MLEAVAVVTELTPDSEVVPGGGRIAAGAHLELVSPEAYTSGLTSDETAVLSLISEGNTTAQMARRLTMERGEVEDHRDSAMGKYGTRSRTVAVSQAIREGAIPIEVTPDSTVAAGLSRLDRRMLGLYAKGVSNHQLAKQYGMNLKTIEAYHDGLLEKVGAWSRPHAIRRTYELGILKV